MKSLGLAVLWFSLLFAWNLLTKQSPDPGVGFSYRCLVAIGNMTTAIQLLLSTAVMVGIWGRNRKSLAERQRAKAEAEGFIPPDEPRTP
jgi:hypothetical protein